MDEEDVATGLALLFLGFSTVMTWYYLSPSVPAWLNRFALIAQVCAWLAIFLLALSHC